MRPHIQKYLCVLTFFLGLILTAHAQTLTHRYSFNEPAGSQTFNDSVGGPSWAGTIVTNGGNPVLDGQQLELTGGGDYASLPAGIMGSDTQITIELWADFSASNPFWTRVFSFGDQNAGAKNSGIDYSHYVGGNYQNLDASGGGADAYANSNPGLNGETNQHVTVVVDPVNNQMYYYNGTTVVSVEHNTVPALSTMNNADSLIGRSLYDTDPTLAGNINEFRVYSGVLSASAVALNDAAGPDTYLTSPGTISSMIFTSPLNPIIVNQSVQQTVIGNFPSVTNLNLVLYGGVTYLSGNTNILTISASGVVKGIAVGTTTVKATYGALSVTNTLTVVSVPTVMTHRYSFAGNANDSIGGANGTFIGDANVTGGQLVLDGGGYLSLPGNIINIATNAAVTIEAWTTIGQTAEWSHLFEFGASGTHNMYCAPRADAGGFHSFGISEGGGVTGGQTLSWAHGWSNITLHIDAVVDPTTSTLAIYTNGVLQQASYTAAAPLTLIATNLATIGFSSYGDPTATLSVREFRIYNGALTPAQIAHSDLIGPTATNVDPGSLSSITVVATNYPAFSTLIAPVILANYPGLANFNLMPNPYAVINGLTVTSSDPTIVSVNPANMLTTYRPGTVTLSATYLGKTSSATIRVGNQAVLTHRYSFTSDASDSVGGANGTLVGTANVTGNAVQLDGGSGDYVNLPPGLLANYRSATIDTWATISGSQQHWARLWEFADIGPATANELYFAPAWNGGANAAFGSFGAPFGGANLGPVGPAMDITVHLTALVGDGTFTLYTNGVLFLTAGESAPASQAGTAGNWIGFSPYGDPGITGSVDEYRIYQGRLSVEEIQASDVIGPNQVLATNPTLTATSLGGNVVLLSWPVQDAGFAVQTKTNVSQSVPWTILPNAPTLAGSQWQMTVTNSNATQFYELIR